MPNSKNFIPTTDNLTGSTPNSRDFRIRGIVGLLIVFFLVAIVVVQWQRTRLMQKLIESAGIQAAKGHLNALETIRAVYTEQVVKVANEHGIEVTHDYLKIDNSIPLPATLTILIGDRIAELGGSRTRLYSPYPFKWREAEGGLRDDFQKEAWARLSADSETPFFRILTTENGHGLRYAIADRMRPSCIQCHNEHPDSPKRGWKVGDVRGILEVEIPLGEVKAIAGRNLLESTVLMVLLAVSGAVICFWVITNLTRVSSELDKRVLELNAINAALDRIVEERTANLRAIGERFELAVRGSTDGLWDWNILTGEVYYSPRFKQLLGYSDDEFSNVIASFEARLHPDDHEWVFREVDAHLKHLKPYDVEYRLRIKSGEYRWFRARGQAIWNNEGQAERMAGSITDMTEQHRLRERFRLAVEASPTALMMVHQDGRILMANSRSLSLFGYTEAELVGQLIELLVPERFRAEHPAHRDQFFKTPAQRAMGAELELLGVRKDGSEIPIKVGLSPVETADGQAVICGVIDITDQKKTMETMRQATEAAESASRIKSSFLANMSHEIRTPMNGIIGMSQLLAQTELRSHQREYLATVDESAHILLRLLNDILDFSKIEAGKLELECIEFRISECVASASRMLSLRAAEKGLEMAGRVAPEIPDHLQGDSGRIQQVLVNLLGNAVKFTEAGEIFVNVSIESISQDVVRLHFSVSDTGIGISPDKLEQVFRPFEQAEASTTRRFGGTGLGLAISKQLVEMMHGRIWVESELARGSTFHFTAEFGVSPDQQGHEPAELSSLQDIPVLVVDDNFTNRRILSEMLKYWQMRPVLADSASSARQAIQKATESRQPIRLILLDHHMPGEDGFHFAASLKRTQGSDSCPIIMISSGSLPVDADLCANHGIDRFMTKPVIASELLNEVLRQFSRFATVKPEQPSHLDKSVTVLPRRVLLVEDNEINRRVALGLLRSRGHQAEVVENGKEAVERLAEQEFDVVLMDMQMPVMDGYEATALIRERERQTGGRIPIVAMTAEALKGDREHCLECGMDDYVSKPISPAEMYLAIERFPAICIRSQSGFLPVPKEPTTDSLSTIPNPAETIPAAQTPSEQSNLPPAIDWNVTKKLLPDGPAMLKEFVDLVKTELPVLLAEIRQAIGARDAKTLRRSSHTMKSSVSYFGATPLIVMARTMEIHGKDESFGGTDELFTAMEQEVARVLAALESPPL